MGLVVFVGKKIFHNFWFERSIFCYGWNTGVVAMGVTLLRVVDPDFKTGTLEDYGVAYVFIAIIEIAVVTVVPGLVANGIIWSPALVLFGAFLICLLLSKRMVGWFNVPADQLREGEAEVIAEFQAEEA
jgi:ESS family glutamate:Na+ symporter